MQYTKISRVRKFVVLQRLAARKVRHEVLGLGCLAGPVLLVPGHSGKSKRALWTASSKITGCHLYNLTVLSYYCDYLLPADMHAVAPSPNVNVNVKVCAGSCAFLPPADTNMTANAIERTILTIDRPYLPEVQCVSTSYRPRASVVLTDTGEIKIRTVNSLQVGSCGSK